MTSLLEYSFDQLQKTFERLGFAKYKAGSAAAWFYKKSAPDFERLSDFSKAERALLQERYTLHPLSLKLLRVSDDGTLKFLFEAADGARIESVIIPGEGDDDEEAPRYTVCVSSQVGCALGCSFCATGRLGFSRNLTVAEIVSQVLLADAEVKTRNGLPQGERAVDNIVFMGMGEPLLNTEAVLKAIEILNDPLCFDIGTRRITVSTAGIIEGIRTFAEAKGQIRLALSLHAANHEKRKNMMPIARKENTAQVLDAIRDYQDKTGRRITIEYILIEGFNDGEEDVLALKHSVHRIKYNLNLIPLNPVPELPYDAPSKRAIHVFMQKLKHHSIPFVLRTAKGVDIDAACGQLALKDRNAREAL